MLMHVPDPVSDTITPATESPQPNPPPHISAHLPPEIQVSVLPIDALPGSEVGRRRTPTEIVVGADAAGRGQVVRLPPPVMSVGQGHQPSSVSQRRAKNGPISSWLPPEITISSQDDARLPSSSTSSAAGGAWVPQEITISSSGVGQRTFPGSHIVQPESVSTRDRNYNSNSEINLANNQNDPLGVSLTVGDPQGGRHRRSPANPPRILSKAKTTTITFDWGAHRITSPTPGVWTESNTTPLPRTFDPIIHNPRYAPNNVANRNFTENPRFSSEFEPNRDRRPSNVAATSESRRPYNPLGFWPTKGQEINFDGSQSASPTPPKEEKTHQRTSTRAAWITDISKDSDYIADIHHSGPGADINRTPVVGLQDNRQPSGRIPYLNQGNNPRSGFNKFFNKESLQIPYRPLIGNHNRGNHKPYITSLHDVVDLSKPLDVPHGSFGVRASGASRLTKDVSREVILRSSIPHRPASRAVNWITYPSSQLIPVGLSSASTRHGMRTSLDTGTLSPHQSTKRIFVMTDGDHQQTNKQSLVNNKTIASYDSSSRNRHNEDLSTLMVQRSEQRSDFNNNKYISAFPQTFEHIYTVNPSSKLRNTSYLDLTVTDRPFLSDSNGYWSDEGFWVADGSRLTTTQPRSIFDRIAVGKIIEDIAPTDSSRTSHFSAVVNNPSGQHSDSIGRRLKELEKRPRGVLPGEQGFAFDFYEVEDDLLHPNDLPWGKMTTITDMPPKRRSRIEDFRGLLLD